MIPGDTQSMKTKIKALGRKIVQNEKLHGRVILGVTLLALIAVLVPLFQIARYNFMSVDDYSYAMHSGQIYKETHSVWKVFAGQIAYVADYYKTWQGTYFSEWLTTSLMGIFCENAYYVGTFLCLGIFVISQVLFFLVVFRKIFKSEIWEAGSVAMSIAILQVLVTTVPVEAFYWFCGAMLYTFIYGLTFLLLTLQILFYYGEDRVTSDGTGKSGHFYLAAVEIGILFFNIAVGGSNYITGLEMVLLYGFIVAWGFYRKRKLKWVNVVNAFIYVAAFLVNVLAPGNSFRQDASGTEHMGAVKAILHALLEAKDYILKSTLAPYVILGLMLLPLFIRIIRKADYRFSVPFLVSCVSFGAFAALFVACIYALGITGAGRIQNIYRWVYLLWLYGNEFYWTGWVVHRIRLSRETAQDTGGQKGKKWCYLLPGWAVGSVVLYWALNLWFGTTLTAVSAKADLVSGAAARYHAEYEERLTVLQDPQIMDVELASFQTTPYLLFMWDMETDPKDWVNQGIAAYFGKNSVRIVR